MRSHSVTCHPAEVTFPPLPQPKLVLDLATAEVKEEVHETVVLTGSVAADSVESVLMTVFAVVEGKVKFHQGACWWTASVTLRAGDSWPWGLVPAVLTAQWHEERSDTEMAWEERGCAWCVDACHHQQQQLQHTYRRQCHQYCHLQ